MTDLPFPTPTIPTEKSVPRKAGTGFVAKRALRSEAYLSQRIAPRCQRKETAALARDRLLSLVAGTA